MNPVSGINPSEVHFFTFCLSAYLAGTNGFDKWSLGSRSKDAAYTNVQRLQFLVATLHSNQQPQTLEAGSNVEWVTDGRVSDKREREFCGKLLRPERMWKTHP